MNAAKCYNDQHSGLKYILIINQAIHISGLVDQILCIMQYCLNGVLISNIPMFLADSLSMTIHAIHIVDPLTIATNLIPPYNYKGSPVIFMCTPVKIPLVI